MLSQLRSYYEEEARQRLRMPLRQGRIDTLRAFIEVLHVEGCQNVIDFGAGPGLDGDGFLDAGLRFVGVDLAHGNAVLAVERNVPVVQASLTAPPFAPNSFDAGWCMSTLQHLPAAEVPDALAAMTAVLKPGAPLHVGLWGGERQDLIDRKLAGQSRLFSLRSLVENQRLLSSHAEVQQATVWPVATDGQEYQLFLLRTGVTTKQGLPDGTVTD